LCLAPDLDHGDELKGWRPILFLNSAISQTGQRIITSTVDFSDQGWFAFDMHETTGRDLAISTAVHHSARFPFISPPGLLVRKEKNSESSVATWVFKGQTIDGGYVDNSGTRTLRDVIRSTLSQLSQNPSLKGKTIIPIVIEIINDGSNEVTMRCRTIGDGKQERNEKRQSCNISAIDEKQPLSELFGEILAPIGGFAASWSGQPSDIAKQLSDDIVALNQNSPVLQNRHFGNPDNRDVKDNAGGGWEAYYFQFALCDINADTLTHLGWAVSSEGLKPYEKSLPEYQLPDSSSECEGENFDSLKNIRNFLAR